MRGTFEHIFDAQLAKKIPIIQAIHIVASGNNYHAAMVGKYWLEALAKVPVLVELSSEYSNRLPPVSYNTLFVALLGQDDLDTLAALTLAKKSNYLHVLLIGNKKDTRASLVSTETEFFTSQLLALLSLSFNIRKEKSLGSEADDFTSELESLSSTIESVVQCEPQFKDIAKLFLNKQHALFLARGVLFPIALEGAIQFKQVAGIHAEGYAAGELKHGPLALVDCNMPIVVLAPKNDLFDKVKSNVAEVQARNGHLFIFTDKPSEFNEKQTHTVCMPTVGSFFEPIIYAICVRLLAYNVALVKNQRMGQAHMEMQKIG